MDLQKLKKDLMAKGISVVASTNEITAGLAWSVEGIEKVPRLGELLFYKVNGVEYGVKPSKGNKHDIHWYYDQLKTGMKGAKGYSAGLTQFLNVWVKKGELKIVYKDDKIVESEFDDEVCVASPQLVSETGIDNLLLSEMSLNANKWNHGATGVCWDIVLKGNKVLVIEYLEDEGTANLTYRNGSAKKDIKGIKTVADLRDKIEEYLPKFNANKATAASPRKYRPSIRERMDRNDAMLDPLEYPMNIRGIIKKYNEFKKKVDDISILGIKPFRAYIDTSNYEDADGIIPVVYVDIKNGKIKINCVDNEKARLFDNLDSINSKYKFKVLDISDYNIAFDAFTSRNELGRSDTFEVSEKDFDSFARDLKRDCAILEDTLKVYTNVKVVASKKITADLEEGENPETEILAFIDDVNGLTIGGKRVFNAEKKDDDIVINLLLKHFETPDMNRLNELVEDKLEILFPITQKWMDADKGKTFGNTKKVGDIVLYADEWSSQEFADHITIEQCSKIDWKDLPYELHSLYKVLERDCSALETNLFKVTADVCEVKETLGELNEENFEGINKEHDRLMYIKVTPEQFLQLWKTSPNFNGQQIQKIVYGFKLALRTLNSKFENKGILIECFYKKKDGKGYIRVEYDKDLYIIYVSRSEDNGEVKVITRKMRKVIPTKNFNILSTSVSSLAFERSNLPSGFKPIWEEVSK